jgi:hypothetical protein
MAIALAKGRVSAGRSPYIEGDTPRRIEPWRGNAGRSAICPFSDLKKCGKCRSACKRNGQLLPTDIADINTTHEPVCSRLLRALSNGHQEAAPESGLGGRQFCLCLPFNSSRECL